MEIHDEQYIQIFHTLEKIAQINNHIAFHKTAETPDFFAVEEWEEIKHDLVQQLQDLLSELGISVQMAIAV